MKNKNNPSSFIDDFFAAFGSTDHNVSLSLPHTNSFYRNVELMAAHHDNTIEPGHGMFFDFTNVPEYEQPVLSMLVDRYGWKLERPFFIRKPEE